MGLKIRRVILFARDVGALARFYRDVLGLRLKGDPRDSSWVELGSGSCTLAIHRGATAKERRGAPKIVFGTRDVAALREQLSRKGARMGPVKGFGTLHRCDGKDPEGNVFQISDRP